MRWRSTGLAARQRLSRRRRCCCACTGRRFISIARARGAIDRLRQNNSKRPWRVWSESASNRKLWTAGWLNSQRAYCRQKFARPPMRWCLRPTRCLSNGRRLIGLVSRRSVHPSDSCSHWGHSTRRERFTCDASCGSNSPLVADFRPTCCAWTLKLMRKRIRNPTRPVGLDQVEIGRGPAAGITPSRKHFARPFLRPCPTPASRLFQSTIRQRPRSTMHSL